MGGKHKKKNKNREGKDSSASKNQSHKNVQIPKPSLTEEENLVSECNEMVVNSGTDIDSVDASPDNTTCEGQIKNSISEESLQVSKSNKYTAIANSLQDTYEKQASTSERKNSQGDKGDEDIRNREVKNVSSPVFYNDRNPMSGPRKKDGDIRRHFSPDNKRPYNKEQKDNYHNRENQSNSYNWRDKSESFDAGGRSISRNNPQSSNYDRYPRDVASESDDFNRRKFRNRSGSRNGRCDKEFTQFEGKYMMKGEDMNYDIVREVEGDLFAVNDEYSLGHCVAEDMNMGSGIAVQFRQIFKRVSELLDQRQTQGHVAVLEDKSRYIYYLVTKRESSRKPTYYSLWSSLQRMKDHILTNNVRKLALPRIACGLDGLEWRYVKKMLEYIFKDVDIQITIFNFQQDTADPPSTKSRKCRVVNQAYPLKDIESGTIMLYFGSEDGHETEEITSLSSKFPVVRNTYKQGPRVLGQSIQRHQSMEGYNFYGCIVRKHNKDPFSFTNFQKCLSKIQTQNRKEQYEYVAFQAFMEEGSTFIVSKIVNLMRHAMTNVDVYVCWPKELQKDMPSV